MLNITTSAGRKVVNISFYYFLLLDVCVSFLLSYFDDMGYDPVVIFRHFSIGSSEGRLTQPPSMFKLPSVPSEAVSSSKEFTEINVFSITC